MDILQSNTRYEIVVKLGGITYLTSRGFTKFKYRKCNTRWYIMDRDA